VPTLRICVLYGSQNKQQLLPYKTLRDGFYNPKWRAFTARYVLSPYIRQIRFVFKGLMYHVTHRVEKSEVHGEEPAGSKLDFSVQQL
jgi:hypothetical protein